MATASSGFTPLKGSQSKMDLTISMMHGKVAYHTTDKDDLINVQRFDTSASQRLLAKVGSDGGSDVGGSSGIRTEAGAGPGSRIKQKVIPIPRFRQIMRVCAARGV